MEFPSPLTQAVLLKRYKRFLAEIVLNNQVHNTIYCPNMGAMTGCDVLGSRVWYSHSEESHRKYPDTWELVEVNDGFLVCVNPLYSHFLIKEGIENNTITELQGYTSIISDPPVLEENGFDLLLENNDDEDTQNPALLCDEKCFVVINNVTLGDEIHRGFFPDAHSDKSSQQLKSLIHAKQLGYRAVLFFCVLHTGIDRIFPADHIDTEYGRLLRQAMITGVEFVGYKAHIDFNAIKLQDPVEICVPARLICTSRP